MSEAELQQAAATGAAAAVGAVASEQQQESRAEAAENAAEAAATLSEMAASAAAEAQSNSDAAITAVSSTAVAADLAHDEAMEARSVAEEAKHDLASLHEIVTQGFKSVADMLRPAPEPSITHVEVTNNQPQPEKDNASTQSSSAPSQGDSGGILSGLTKPRRHKFGRGSNASK